MSRPTGVTTIHVDLGELGRFPVAVSERIAAGLEEQTAADGQSVFETTDGKRQAARALSRAGRSSTTLGARALSQVEDGCDPWIGDDNS